MAFRVSISALSPDESYSIRSHEAYGSLRGDGGCIGRAISVYRNFRWGECNVAISTHVTKEHVREKDVTGEGESREAWCDKHRGGKRTRLRIGAPPKDFHRTVLDLCFMGFLRVAKPP